MATTKAHMKSIYTPLHVGVLAVLSLTAFTATNPAFARSPSTYQNSCRRTFLDGNVLSALCRSRDGSREQKTSIVLRGINNRNGKLVDDGGDAPASFQKSCYNANVIADELTALCFELKGQQSFLNKIKIQGIRNDDGNLRY